MCKADELAKAVDTQVPLPATSLPADRMAATHRLLAPGAPNNHWDAQSPGAALLVRKQSGPGPVHSANCNALSHAINSMLYRHSHTLLLHIEQRDAWQWNAACNSPMHEQPNAGAR